jgi:hypothetical protein
MHGTMRRQCLQRRNLNLTTTSRSLHRLKEGMAPWIPSRNCIYRVRTILAARKLPNELILAILDYARYWVEQQRHFTDLMVLMDEAFSLNYSAACPYFAVQILRSMSESEAPKIQEIEFLLVSHGTLEIHNRV